MAPQFGRKFDPMIDMDLPAGLSLVDQPLPGIKVDTELCSSVVYFNGAHVAHWQPKTSEHPVLWVSQKSIFEPGRALRGGVPVIYPWFGAGRSGEQKPNHGFGRISQWTLQSATMTARQAARLIFRLTQPSGLPGLDAYRDATVELHLAIGAVLQMSLVVTAENGPVDFEAGFHNYLAVGDVRQVRVEGLDQASYADKVSGQTATQTGDVVIDAEVDRIYQSSANTRIIDPAWGRTIRVDKVASASTVVWNPWAAKAAALADFGDDEWTQMLCVEPINAGQNAVQLPHGQRHMLSQVISVG